jgi:ribosomal protein S19E (S16A)
MQTTNLAQALLISIFRTARSGRRPNLTALCRRQRASAAQLQDVFDQLEAQGLLTLTPEGERLTLAGLAVAAALSRRSSERHRPLASCGPLAA